MPLTNKIFNGVLTDSWGRRNRKLSDINCEHCGKLFRPIDSKKRTCSRTCGYAIRRNGSIKLRKKEVWWTDAKGYIQGKVWIDENTQIRVKQHRWIMEQFLKRRLNPNEDIHHINGNKKDNRIVNLQVISHSGHTKISNCRAYKKGYKLNLSVNERKRRSDHLRSIRKKATK